MWLPKETTINDWMIDWLIFTVWSNSLWLFYLSSWGNCFHCTVILRFFVLLVRWRFLCRDIGYQLFLSNKNYFQNDVWPVQAMGTGTENKGNEKVVSSPQNLSLPIRCSFYQEYSDYWLHFYCFPLNVSDDMFSTFSDVSYWTWGLAHNPDQNP